MSEVDACIQATVEAIQPLYRAVNQAEWEAALAGTPENNGRQQAAQAAYMRFWADPGRYADLKRLLESGAATDPIQARQLKVLYLDFDGFFASVAQQADPRLRGKPVGIVPFDAAPTKSMTVIAVSKEAS